MMKKIIDRLTGVTICETPNVKTFKSDNYNLYFRKTDGYTTRWGRTFEEDPVQSPFPEILDIEISTSLPDDQQPPNDLILVDDNPCKRKHCASFCYKENSSGCRSVHMSLKTIKEIIQRIRPYTTQVALGICSVYSHPQLFEILWEFRNNGIVPNLTLSDENITDEVAKKLSEVCGACAISVNKHNKDGVYNTIKKLSQDFGMKQINIHFMIAEETIDDAFSVVNDIKNDPRLSKLNAFVMLHLKKCGQQANKFNYPDKDKYRKLVEYCESNRINFGFDSCSAWKYLEIIKDRQNFKDLEQCVEPCESGCFSFYCNVFGAGFPCSFSENTEEGINILEYKSIVDVWNTRQVKNWRRRLLKNNRKCPIYSLD